jgi:hypothetical protein
VLWRLIRLQPVNWLRQSHVWFYSRGRPVLSLSNSGETGRGWFPRLRYPTRLLFFGIP